MKVHVHMVVIILGHVLVTFIERWSLYTCESTCTYGCNHIGTCPSDLYREVVIIKGGLLNKINSTVRT